MNPTEKSDAKLVALSLEDPEHFGALMDRYEKKLARYIKRLSGFDQLSVEDVLQEAFIKIYQNLNNFDPDLSFSSSVKKIRKE